MGDINFEDIVDKVKDGVENVVGKAEDFVKSEDVQNFMKNVQKKAGVFAGKAKDAAVDAGGKLAEEAGELGGRAKELFEKMTEKKDEASEDEAPKDGQQ